MVVVVVGCLCSAVLVVDLAVEHLPRLRARLPTHIVNSQNKIKQSKSQNKIRAS